MSEPTFSVIEGFFIVLAFALIFLILHTLEELRSKSLKKA